MKIGVMSDLHLGKRQYGLIDRENDFYKQYKKCIHELKDCDIVIIAGDIFDNPNPSPKAIHEYVDGIKMLNGIPVVTIQGNHTMVMRDNHYSVDELVSDNNISNYFLLEDESHTINNISFDGITYKKDKNDFIKVQKDLAKKTKKLDSSISPRILIIHQAFAEFCGYTGEELSFYDMDYKPYDYIICGHIHHPLSSHIDSTIFIQPGSVERLNMAEAQDEIINGKGVFIIDTDTNKYEFIKVENPRKFFSGEVTFNKKEDSEAHISDLNNKIMDLEVPPIISYKYFDETGGLLDFWEDVKCIDNVLLNNSKISVVEEDVDYDEVDSILIDDLIADRLTEKYDKVVARLGVDLFHASKDFCYQLVEDFRDKNK